ncbi:PH domain-containing protein [Flavobacterium sp. CYK-4]|uniref:PH domain-containing protein n=1 Tax=Flavobacterium lotistagni TaxID=2709660 RepID=UPI001407B699|nr:PH domain-containing protein [Flavobacterium lotistagni]NHM07730.1 PH domain-containing protein [Flavobacterium lotistagni]
MEQFRSPQRQSSIGILVLFFDTLRQYFRALWPILVVWFFKYNHGEFLYVVLGIVLIVVLVGVVAYLKYINFTFYLDPDKEEFIIHEGIWNKTRTTIQLHKIQQVNITQSLVQRLIGVYALNVDTAGSSDKEGHIKAISHELALELKSKLLHNERKKLAITPDSNEHTSNQAEPNHPFISISFLSLVKMGITSNYVRSFSLLLLFFFTIIDYADKLLNVNLWENEGIENYVDTQRLVRSIFVIVLILFGIVIALNLSRMIIKYFDYKITRQKGSLLLSFGLLNTKSTIIKPEKVQITSVSQNYFQKKMDILQLKIKQAAHNEKEERKTGIEIPGCNQQEKEAIFNLLFQKIPQKGFRLKPNYRKLGFAVFLTIVLPLLGYFFFRNNIPTFNKQYDYIAGIYVIFVGLVQYFKFRNSRLFIHDDFIILQSGAWDISHEIIEPSKIQAITTSQLFWHKSIDVGSLILHTAGGNIAFQLGNFTTIKSYVNLWLYELERSDSNWM